MDAVTILLQPVRSAPNREHFTHMIDNREHFTHVSDNREHFTHMSDKREHFTHMSDNVEHFTHMSDNRVLSASDEADPLYKCKSCLTG